MWYNGQMEKTLLSKFTNSAKVAQAQRNLREDDLVLLQDTNILRGQWKIGVVLKTFPGEDGRVRRVQVQYKKPKPGEAVSEYHGRGFVTVE